jgi:hypothetical protein
LLLRLLFVFELLDEDVCGAFAYLIEAAWRNFPEGS